MTEFFNASQWYSLVKNSPVHTPDSVFVEIPPGPGALVCPVVRQKVNKFLNEHHEKAFVRMDMASAKIVLPCCTFAEVERNLRSSERTLVSLREIEAGRCGGRLMLREFVDDMRDHLEMRCFIHQGRARGVHIELPEQFASINQEFLVNQLRVLRGAMNTIAYELVAATEYQDFVADVALKWVDLMAVRPCERMEVAATSLRKNLWLVEINTPVYLLATSGYFSLNLESHQEVLVGPVLDLFEYPFIIASISGKQSKIELFDVIKE